MFLVLPDPVAFYPLDGEYKATERENKQPSGILGTVALTVGPYTESTGAYEFFGNNTSYIEFPNDGILVSQPYSITLMCWVEPGGQDGPLFLFHNGQTERGVGIWINLNGKFYNEFHKENNTNASLAVGEWVHVASTYNNETGENSLYINGVLNKAQNIGAGFSNSTHDRNASMGVKGDRYFKGKIAQMKIYDAALDEAQITAAINQGIKKESSRSSSNKWTKTLYQDYLHSANFCSTVLNTFSKEIISNNTKCRKQNFEVHLRDLKVLVK